MLVLAFLPAGSIVIAMQSLESVFEQRASSDYNRQLIENLEELSEAHDRRPIGSNPYAAMTARIWETSSASEGEASIVVNRDSETLASHHELTVEQLTDFADGGRVVDVGAGKSDFLDAFSEPARETVAVDRHRPFVDYQCRRGHRAMVACADRLIQLESDSVRLLHASFSAPFWSPTAAAARGVAKEYLRVLEPGGVALVGPVSAMHEHEHYEFFLQSRRYQGQEALPWPDAYDDAAYLSHVKNAFVAAVLSRRATMQLVGTRMLFDDVSTIRLRDRLPAAVHVPNFLMIRRDGER
jgi:hypothetical protein